MSRSSWPDDDNVVVRAIKWVVRFVADAAKYFTHGKDFLEFCRWLGLKLPPTLCKLGTRVWTAFVASSGTALVSCAIGFLIAILAGWGLHLLLMVIIRL